MNNQFDIVILGAGPGGYVAALAAANAGMKVAVVEKNSFYGGTCLNTGCIPTKTMLAAADIMHQIKNAKQFGIACNLPELDWQKLQEKKSEVIGELRKGIAKLFRSRKVRVYQGNGKIITPNSVLVEGNKHHSLITKNIIIATGTRPFIPEEWTKIPGVITSDELIGISEIPKDITIVGGGYIGCEFAYLLKQFGTKIDLVEREPQLLPMMDTEQTKVLYDSLVELGVKLHLGEKVKKLQKQKNRCKVSLNSDEEWTSRYVLVAIGRQPALGKSDLESLDFAIDENKYIHVDENLQTSVQGIYCIGDANGKSLLAHAAMNQAEYVIDILTRRTRSPYEQKIPYCVYTNPELASAGLTEKQAIEKGHIVITGKFPLTGLGKSHAIGKIDGFIKIIRDVQNGTILGVHIVGHGATEIIHSALPWLWKSVSELELEKIVFAHPTFSEGLKHALEDSFSGAIHLPARKPVSIPASILP